MFYSSRRFVRVLKMRSDCPRAQFNSCDEGRMAIRSPPSPPPSDLLGFILNPTTSLFALTRLAGFHNMCFLFG